MARISDTKMRALLIVATIDALAAPVSVLAIELLERSFKFFRSLDWAFAIARYYVFLLVFSLALKWLLPSGKVKTRRSLVVFAIVTALAIFVLFECAFHFGPKFSDSLVAQLFVIHP